SPQGLVQQQQIHQPTPTQREENRAALLQQLSARVPALSTPSLPTQQSTIPPRHQQQQQQQQQQPMSSPHTMRQLQAQALRSHSVTPPQIRDKMLEVHRARSQHESLRSDESNPIYQTSGVGRGAGPSLSVEERREQFELSSLNAKMSSINLWETGTSPMSPTPPRNRIFANVV
ncbi:hypothetical protein MPER_10186, partial [Moniliophthora perniciosa FA553]